MKGPTIPLAIFVASMVALLIVYPWNTYYGNFEFGRGQTLWSYVFVALVLITALAISGAIFRSLEAKAPARYGAATALTALAAIAMVALLFGPCGVNIPGLRVRGIFFSEWKFLTFIGLVALPVSALAGILGWISGRTKVSR